MPAHKFKLLIRKSDGRINGTQLVNQNSTKRFTNWTQNKQTKKLIETMESAGILALWNSRGPEFFCFDFKNF